MANRSDFFKAKLPRSISRMLTLTGMKKDSHYNGKVKRMFIEAHAVHVKHRLDVMRGKDLDSETNEK